MVDMADTADMVDMAGTADMVDAVVLADTADRVDMVVPADTADEDFAKSDNKLVYKGTDPDTLLRYYYCYCYCYYCCCYYLYLYQTCHYQQNFQMMPDTQHKYIIQHLM